MLWSCPVLAQCLVKIGIVTLRGRSCLSQSGLLGSLSLDCGGGLAGFCRLLICGGVIVVIIVVVTTMVIVGARVSFCPKRSLKFVIQRASTLAGGPPVILLIAIV